MLKSNIKFKPFLGISIFLIGLVVFSFTLYQITPLKNKFPWLNNQILAYKYERMAKKLPASDFQAKRLKAMAEALRKGSEDYQFETGPLPPMGQK